MIIETPRLILRTFQEGDKEPFIKINQCQKVMEHFPKTLTKDETITLIEKINHHYQQHGYTLYALERKDNGVFIGFTGLLQPYFTIPNFVPTHLPVVEIGWRLNSHNWRQGFATEAARAVLAYAKDHLLLKEIVSFTTKTNIASQALMNKIGLQYAGEFMHPKLADDSPLKPHVLYTRKIDDCID